MGDAHRKNISAFVANEELSKKILEMNAKANAIAAKTEEACKLLTECQSVIKNLLEVNKIFKTKNYIKKMLKYNFIKKTNEEAEAILIKLSA